MSSLVRNYTSCPAKLSRILSAVILERVWVLPILFLESSFFNDQAWQNELLWTVRLQVRFLKQWKWAEVKHQQLDWVTCVSAKHAHFYEKSAIFRTKNQIFPKSLVSWPRRRATNIAQPIGQMISKEVYSKPSVSANPCAITNAKLLCKKIVLWEYIYLAIPLLSTDFNWKVLHKFIFISY